jgi:hypothetical protein
MVRTFFTLLFLSIYLPIFSQPQKEVFNTSAITWYGLDFFHAKLIGSFAQFNDAGQKNADEIRDIYFPAWNRILIDEKDKYNLKKAFDKISVAYDLETADKRNKAVKSDQIFLLKSTDKNRLTRDSISEIVKNYKTGKKGIGLVFVIDNFDKTASEGVMHVTFFDTSTGNALIIQRMSGEPGGFGIKNYWARTVYNVINKSRSAYKDWKKNYK